MEIRGRNLTIRPMKLEDINSMINWGKHKNPLFFDYNFPSLDNKEIIRWYYIKILGIRKKYYSIFDNSNNLIGYMGIKNIRWLKRESTLGIVFDPNYINQGYGTECIHIYLNYYFTHMKMKKMYLEVAEYNKRAIRCYKKNGFNKTHVYSEMFFDQKLDVTSPYYKREKTSFNIKNGRVYFYINKMEIDRKRYFTEVVS